MEHYRHHHILFSRRLWRSQDPSLKLREQQWLKPLLDDEVHLALHKAVYGIPVPDWDMSQSILSHFEPSVGDYVRSLDNLLTAVENTKHDRHTNVIQRELGQVVLHSIELQRPFIIEGLINGTH